MQNTTVTLAAETTHLAGSSLCLRIRSSSNSALQFGQRPGMFSFFASSQIRWKHLSAPGGALRSPVHTIKTHSVRELQDSHASNAYKIRADITTLKSNRELQGSLPQAQGIVAVAKADGGICGVQLICAHFTVFLVHNTVPGKATIQVLTIAQLFGIDHRTNIQCPAIHLHSSLFRYVDDPQL